MGALLLLALLAAHETARAEESTEPDASAAAEAQPDASGDAQAQPEQEGGAPSTRMQEVVVHGRAEDLVGTAESASQGFVGHEQIESRPLLRPGETLETVPGLIATQHSGGGKANQYFLRGMNLDHGTDLAVSMDGMPLNLPSHGHGQGYTDLNFVIPELIRDVSYEKGPYYPEQGDFSSAGAFAYHYFDALPRGIAKLEGGQFDYGRLLLADSPALGDGHLLYAIEGLFNGGPWDHADDYYKANGVLRWSRGDAHDGLSITAIGYHGHWNSTDQIPDRAIQDHSIDAFDAIDPSDAGRSTRASLSGEWRRQIGGGQATVLLYGYYYDLDLYSNFTYFLDDPVRGDQFEQKDSRFVMGLVPTYRWDLDLLGHTFTNTVGLQVRSDRIHNGLYSTEERNRFEATRHDAIWETSTGVFFKNEVAWTEWFRSVAGSRVDVFAFDVDSSLPENSNGTTAVKVSPKLGLIFGPWYQTELYLNGGFGFHSNDARGVEGRVDPKTGDPVDGADPLVRTKGAEIGVRTAAVPGLQSSVAFWLLDIDSELLFVGDAGTNEPSRPSRRYGVELSNFYDVTPWLTLDADVALSHARFREHAPEGDYIPGSIETVVATGVTLHDLYGFFGSVRMRHFGARPLTEDDQVRSKTSTLIDLQAGYQLTEHWSVALDVFNVFDARVSDIDYFYTSRLPGEPAEGVDDVHTHPAEPRAFRGMLTYRFGE